MFLKPHLIVWAGLACLSAAPAYADDFATGGYNTYGSPGLIDMPSAWMPDDGTLAFTTSYFRNQLRNTLTFQIAPRLSGSFRYAQLYDVSPSADGNVVDFRFDRSFSLSYRLFEETNSTPAVVIGMNDFLGTGLYKSEHIVASKTIAPGLTVTGGLGWGRLAGRNGFDNPLSVFGDRFDERAARESNFGGQVELGNVFTGDAAFFGGVEWHVNDDLRVTAEYSSDNYPFEAPSAFEIKSPVNLGLSYRFSDRITLDAHYLYGSELGLQATFALDPAKPLVGSGTAPAPVPVTMRRDAPIQQWRPALDRQMRSLTRRDLNVEGITLTGLDITDGRVRAHIQNNSYIAAPEAVGRTMRVLSRTAPADLDVFDVILTENGLPVSSVSIRRDDIETLEHATDGAFSALARANITDASGQAAQDTTLYPLLDYGLRPYLTPSLFDPDDPLRADVGVEAFGTFEAAPGLVFSGTVRQKLFGTLDQADRPSTSILERVRSESNIYDANATTYIPSLTAAYYMRPAEDIYARVTAGYLETMFGGVSAEMLWYPTNSRFALGAEINYVKQRDFDQLFDFRDYDVVTGHLSGYYSFENGFHAQLDVGRYLAGDYGGTFTLEREFENGWRVGAFATLTDVPFDDFGEGSFDKGLLITIPLSGLSNTVTRDSTEFVVRPILRDGGARLNVDGRLYDVVRPNQGVELRDTWGRFWR